jgi:hypothetical protein
MKAARTEVTANPDVELAVSQDSWNVTNLIGMFIPSSDINGPNLLRCGGSEEDFQTLKENCTAVTSLCKM